MGRSGPKLRVLMAFSVIIGWAKAMPKELGLQELLKGRRPKLAIHRIKQIGHPDSGLFSSNYTFLQLNVCRIVFI